MRRNDVDCSAEFRPARLTAVMCCVRLVDIEKLLINALNKDVICITGPAFDMSAFKEDNKKLHLAFCLWFLLNPASESGK